MQPAIRSLVSATETPQASVAVTQSGVKTAMCSALVRMIPQMRQNQGTVSFVQGIGRDQSALPDCQRRVNQALVRHVALVPSAFVVLQQLCLRLKATLDSLLAGSASAERSHSQPSEESPSV